MYQILTYYQENSQKILDYKMKSRSLWNDHVGYTRNAIISTLSNLPDAAAVSQRLLKNQEDIGNFFSPYYSTQQVGTLVNLLKQHINIAVDVIKNVEGAEQQWRTNGQEIVNHLYQMNRMFWPVSVTEVMWNKHLDLTISEIGARKTSKWQDDISYYDENQKCMNDFADIISTGVIHQNLSQFCLS